MFLFGLLLAVSCSCRSCVWNF